MLVIKGDEVGGYFGKCGVVLLGIEEIIMLRSGGVGYGWYDSAELTSEEEEAVRLFGRQICRLKPTIRSWGRWSYVSGDIRTKNRMYLQGCIWMVQVHKPDIQVI